MRKSGENVIPLFPQADTHGDLTVATGQQSEGGKLLRYPTPEHEPSRLAVMQERWQNRRMEWKYVKHRRVAVLSVFTIAVVTGSIVLNGDSDKSLDIQKAGECAYDVEPFAPPVGASPEAYQTPGQRAAAIGKACVESNYNPIAARDLLTDQSR